MADDGFKWFGEGFDGFPKRLPDDCVEYAVYIVDQKLDTPTQIRSRLNEVLKSANDLEKQYLKDFIWQRDGFSLKFNLAAGLPEPSIPDRTKIVAPHLRGRTNFGDSVADEWLVVYLLLTISKQFKDAWIRIYDTDGEFLLIEAANFLPKWLNPDIAENRVWLNDGHIKILSLEDDANPRNIDLKNALSMIRKASNNLLIDPAIEREAFHRVREYPSAISSSLHNALITIPRRLAYILGRNPAYVSPAIEAFYLRDLISLKPLNTKDIATLKFPPEDFVTVSVKFPKVGFAQVRSQVFDPPPAWTAILPRMQDEKVAIGMKVTCGFEVLVTDKQNQDKQSVREIQLLLEDIESGDEALPSNSEISKWPKTQDDEKWLDIDYKDFENELSGKETTVKKDKASSDGLGNKDAQENLREMVSRFQAFVNDDEAGVDGIDDEDDDGSSSSNASEASQDEETQGKDSAIDESEFEKAMKATRVMHSSEIEQNGLLAEARRFALEDEEEDSDIAEDEELREVMERMEKELKAKGALDANGTTKGIDRDNGKPEGKARSIAKPFFGPERPPHLQSSAVMKRDALVESDEDIGPGNGELSSDDEDYNDLDLDLAKNMLESFKGQAGLSGPAGNLMRSMGINMPRDEGEDD